MIRDFKSIFCLTSICYKFICSNILGTTSIVATVIATTLGVLLLILFFFGVYKQKQITQNDHPRNGTGKIEKENGAVERNSYRSINDSGSILDFHSAHSGSQELCDIADIHNENCPSLANFPIQKTNPYSNTKEYDRFDYLKDVPRCRCYSV